MFYCENLHNLDENYVFLWSETLSKICTFKRGPTDCKKTIKARALKFSVNIYNNTSYGMYLRKVNQTDRFFLQIFFLHFFCKKIAKNKKNQTEKTIDHII